MPQPTPRSLKADEDLKTYYGLIRETRTLVKLLDEYTKECEYAQHSRVLDDYDRLTMMARRRLDRAASRIESAILGSPALPPATANEAVSFAKVARAVLRRDFFLDEIGTDHWRELRDDPREEVRIWASDLNRRRGKVEVQYRKALLAAKEYARMVGV